MRFSLRRGNSSIYYFQPSAHSARDNFLLAHTHTYTHTHRFIYLSIYLSIYIYIQSWPKRLTHYDFWKIIAFGSKNEFKMGDQCYHILEEVPLNISRGVPNHWPNSALWSIHIIST